PSCEDVDAGFDWIDGLVGSSLTHKRVSNLHPDHKNRSVCSGSEGGRECVSADELGAGERIDKADRGTDREESGSLAVAAGADTDDAVECRREVAVAREAGGGSDVADGRA